MDIAVLLEQEEYEYFLSHPVSENHDNTNMHVCSKKLRRARPGERVYFKVGDNIVGYSVIFDHQIIGGALVASIPDKLWQFRGYIAIRWTTMNWYAKPIEYKKKIKLFGMRYFNLKRALKDRSEPRIIEQKGWIPEIKSEYH